METEYPLFYKCLSQSEWDDLEEQANTLLGLPNESMETYSRPILDINKDIYFIVNPEVSDLVDLDECLNPSQITFPGLQN
jgi:hypothetical protein